MKKFLIILLCTLVTITTFAQHPYMGDWSIVHGKELIYKDNVINQQYEDDYDKPYDKVTFATDYLILYEWSDSKNDWKAEGMLYFTVSGNELNLDKNRSDASILSFEVVSYDGTTLVIRTVTTETKSGIVWRDDVTYTLLRYGQEGGSGSGGGDTPTEDNYINGIYYKFDSSNLTAKVTSGTNKYTGHVTIPSSVIYNGSSYTITGIGERAFLDNTVLTSVTLPNTIERLWVEAFRGCTMLTEIDIPNSVTMIDDKVFKGCTSLQTIKIGSGITAMLRPFENCTSMKDFYCYATTPPTLNDVVFTSALCGNATLHVPAGTIDTYRNANSQWTTFGSIVAIGDSGGGDTPSGEEKHALIAWNQMTLQENTEYSTLKGNTGTDAEGFQLMLTGRTDKNYYNRTGQSITVNYQDTNRDAEVIYTSNAAQNTLVLPEGYMATDITIWGFTVSNPDRDNYWQEVAGVHYTEETAPLFFGNATPSEPYHVSYHLTTPAKIITFTNKGSQQAVILDIKYRPKNSSDPTEPTLYLINGIYYELNETTLQAVVCPRPIGNYSGSITIPVSVTHGNTSYTVTQIADNAFYTCREMTSISLPNTITAIGKMAFRDARGLSDITIPANVKSIGEQAFDNCTSLNDVYCNALTVPTTEGNIFDTRTLAEATLHVPASALTTYQSTSPWSRFTNIVAIGSGGNTETKCATPIVNYSAGRLMFSSTTPGATFHSTITDSDIKSYETSEVNLSVTYTVQVYATAPGYEQSETTWVSLCWIDATPVTDIQKATTVEARPILILSSGSILTISGIEEGTPVIIYSIGGQQTNSAVADSNSLTIDSRLAVGSVALVSIGDKTMKMVIR